MQEFLIQNINNRQHPLMITGGYLTICVSFGKATNTRGELVKRKQ